MTGAGLTTADVIQTGGVLAFAGLVLYIVRQALPVLAGLREELFEMRITLAAILERERIRDVRRRRESSGPHPAAVPAEVDDETTDIVALMDRQREAAKRRRTERAPRAGTHHD